MKNRTQRGAVSPALIAGAALGAAVIGLAAYAAVVYSAGRQLSSEAKTAAAQAAELKVKANQTIAAAAGVPPEKMAEFEKAVAKAMEEKQTSKAAKLVFQAAGEVSPSVTAQTFVDINAAMSKVHAELQKKTAEKAAAEAKLKEESSSGLRGMLLRAFGFGG